MVTNLDYSLKHNRVNLEKFLKTQGLEYDENIDTALVIKENDKIVACACKKDNIFKMIAVSCHYQSMDYVAKMISELINICHQQNIFHYFIFTKMEYKVQFESIGFELLVSYKEIGLFEMGRPAYKDCYTNIKPNDNQGAIVMNCNPFTLGHRYLIEQALKHVDSLIIFVVEEDKSFFKFTDRIELVRQGVNDLDNVQVINSGPYIISSATFPTYFLKQIDDKLEYYTNLDILMFKKIMNDHNIIKRIVGSEPIDKLTSYYNSTMYSQLNDSLVEVERLKINDEYVSASKVRESLANKDFKSIKNLVPKTTYDFLINNYGDDTDE